MQSYTYLFVDLACIAVPFIASFYKKHAFYKEWSSFFKANIIVALLFIIWDSIFTNLGIWGFNTDYLTGVHLGNLPIRSFVFYLHSVLLCLYLFRITTYY